MPDTQTQAGASQMLRELGLNAALTTAEQLAFRTKIATFSPAQESRTQLSSWFSGGVKGKKIALIGDSTTLQLGTTWLNDAIVPGGLLESCVTNYYPSNGATAAFINAGVLQTAIATHPDLYIYSAGINDVRQGSRTQAQLEGDIVIAVEAMITDRPNCSIILRMPNPFLTTTDAGNYVSPNSSAQLYSNQLRDAYRNMKNRWPNVWVWDTQMRVFGETSLAASALMSDQIHPSAAGYLELHDDLLKIIGQATTYSHALAYAASQVSATTPWVTYHRVLEDPLNYDLVFTGRINNTGSGFIDITYPDVIPDTRIGDVLYQSDVEPFAITSAGTYVNPGIMRIAMTSPFTLTVGNIVRIYRQKYFGSSTIQAAKQRGFAFGVDCYVNSGGTNFIDLMPRNPEARRNMLRLISTADTLAIEGQASVALTAAGFATQNTDGSGYVRVLVTGSFAGYVGKAAYVYGTGIRALANGFDLPGAKAIGDYWVDPTSKLPQIRVGVTPATRTVQAYNSSVVIATTAALATWSETIAQTTANAAFVGTLPTVCAVGDRIRVIILTSGGGAIAQNAGQSIRNAAGTVTTVGTGGSITLPQYANVDLLCTTANTGFLIVSSAGTVTLI